MRRHRAEGSDRESIGANMTPMIDVTFLLIIFFVVVSQLVDLEQAEVDLPRLVEPTSEVAGEETRVVINLLYGGEETGGNGELQYGGRRVRADQTGLEAVGAWLSERTARREGLLVQVRADGRARYEVVYPLLEVIRASAGARGAAVQLVIVPEGV